MNRITRSYVETLTLLTSSKRTYCIWEASLVDIELRYVYVTYLRMSLNPEASRQLHGMYAGALQPKSCYVRPCVGYRAFI